MKAFVTVGVERMPFNRLVRAVDEAVKLGVLSPESLMQTGHTPAKPEYCQWTAFLTFDEMVRHIEETDVVICHAGVGSVLLCHELGRVPLIMPRNGNLGEHVDNHQQEFARVMESEGVASVAHDGEAMANMLKQAPRVLLEKRPPNGNTNTLAENLGAIIRELGRKGG